MGKQGRQIVGKNRTEVIEKIKKRKKEILKIKGPLGGKIGWHNLHKDQKCYLDVITLKGLPPSPERKFPGTKDQDFLVCISNGCEGECNPPIEVRTEDGVYFVCQCVEKTKR